MSELVLPGKIFELKRRSCRAKLDDGWKFDHGPYLIDEDLAYVECGTCGEKMNPIAVLKAYATHENTIRNKFFGLKAVLEKAKFKAERQNRVRCEHCEKLTRIRK